MRAASQPDRAPAAFEYELERFRGLSGKYIQYWLNWFFDLTIQGAARRRKWIAGFYLVFALITILSFAN